VWGWSPTLGKVGIWSPPGLPNVQSSTARPKTPRIGVFLVSLERSWSVDIENGLALAIWTFVAQVMGKRRAGVKLSLPTTKSRESTSSKPPNWECNTLLERWRRGLQVWFRPRRDQTLQSGVMSSQSPGTPPKTPPGTISGLQLGSPGKMCHLDVVPETWRRKYYMGEGGGFPRVWVVVCLVVQSAHGLSQHPRVSRNVN
jgi:hypothetical protein